MLVAGDVPSEITQAAHQELANASDAFVIPQNRTQEIGSNLLTVQNALEDMGFPADWVTATMTYNQVLRLVWAAIDIFQRVAGILNTTVPFIAGVVTLNTQFQDIPSAGRAALLQVRDERNIDDSELSNTSTLREIIKTYADQIPMQPFRGEVF
jgi:hypothetical protein